MSRFFKAEIVSNLSLNSKTNLLTVKPLEKILNPHPGQFYMIKVSNSKDPLLSRPFSFFRESPEGIQFLFEIRGKGTLMMKGFEIGEIINLLGPLGKGYPALKENKIPLLISGGIGIASIYSLAEEFGKKSILFYGAKSSESLLMIDELKGLVNELIIGTDDGSVGKKGTVVDVLNDFLMQTNAKACDYTIYGCGPKPMLKAISEVAFEKKMEGYVSVEENMACGVGACLACAIKVKRPPFNSPLTKGGYRGVNEERGRITNSEPIYKLVCRDGPVFPLEEIVW
ncbi:MAG: dihydroorotate dehydrogenase electron transfer subunit [Nitrospirae bacterium]|nr:dihydroorotate dehydrogenase electron transfer subunit [Nitrospirota bacterium]